MGGHLRRWMEDATENVLAAADEPNELACVMEDEAQAGDYQAARELETLTLASKAALDSLYALHHEKHSGGSCPNVYKCSSAAAKAIRDLEDALLAVE